mmetsp:Transcript_10375/g.29608  ORF Transcript_10375/g.29608 Transcript_10375/m.29608 type:complete len:165 (+) Transcript_10375:945-1439(+)
MRVWIQVSGQQRGKDGTMDSMDTFEDMMVSTTKIVNGHHCNREPPPLPYDRATTPSDWEPFTIDHHDDDRDRFDSDRLCNHRMIRNDAFFPSPPHLHHRRSSCYMHPQDTHPQKLRRLLRRKTQAQLEHIEKQQRDSQAQIIFIGIVSAHGQENVEATASPSPR